MYSNNASVISTNIHTSVQYKGGELHGIISAKKDSKLLAHRDAGTTGAAGASAPLAFCIFNFVGAVRVQTMGVTGAQNFYNRQN
jgi:hypothetical protein